MPGSELFPTQGYEVPHDQVVLQVMRHYGMSNPSAEDQRAHSARAEVTLAKIGVVVTHVAHGVTMAGGTPAHRWLEVAVDGAPIGHKILVTNQADVERELDRLATITPLHGMPRGALSVIAPEDWPVQDFFGSFI